jgi:stalled ribosome rescue protein Dom34
MASKEQPMTHYHAVVWLDHHEAKVFHFNAAEMGELRVMPAKPHVHLHHHRGSNTDGHAKEDQHYYHNVAMALADASEVLVCGPGLAKNELVKHVENHDPAWRKKVVGVETVDHPSDNQIIAHARKYFLAADKMKSQLG